MSLVLDKDLAEARKDWASTLAKDYAEEAGVWRTVRGRRVFIREALSDLMGHVVLTNGVEDEENEND